MEMTVETLKRQAVEFVRERLFSIANFDYIADEVAAAWHPDPIPERGQGLTDGDKQTLDTLAKRTFDYADLRRILSWLIA